MESQLPATRLLQTIRNLLLVVAGYLVVTGTLQFFYYGSFTATRPIKPQGQKYSSSSPPNHPTVEAQPKVVSSGIYSKLRPDSLVVANDAYMGPRPHADTYANFTQLVEVCRGSMEGLEKMKDVYGCMKYLAEQESDYYYIPSSDKPSQGYSGFVAATEESTGKCNGPIVPYHVWWSGKCTWRVELFVKSYFHSQNLPCSRLNLWLDHDVNPNAIDDMMRDPLFARFLPLVRRGDLKLRVWKFPAKVLLRKVEEGEGAEPGKVFNAGDGVYIDENGLEWLEFSQRKMTFLPVAISDAVRFVVLHYEGGVYCDMDNVLLRDLRPFLLPPNHGFAERWAWQEGPWDYNTAIMSLHANSSLSQHFLKGAVKMGINFHPYIIGRMVYKDGRGDEFAMFEDGFFDPIWGQFNAPGTARCTAPCLENYSLAFQGTKDANPREWVSFEGVQKEIVDGGVSGDSAGINSAGRKSAERKRSDSIVDFIKSPLGWGDKRIRKRWDGSAKDQLGSSVKRDLNERAPTGFAKGYDINKDPYPPTNRTLENFFRGGYAYHIHNQWAKHPEPNSWLDVVRKTHDGFFSGKRVNMYGEEWTGPLIKAYDRFPEFD